jgi:hypothetical protein
MTTRLRLLLASLTFSAVVVGRAESVPARSAAGRPLGSILTALDSNRDGILSAMEIAAAPVALAALDSNEDGMISPNDNRTTNVGAQRVRLWRGLTSFNVVLTLDANHDGVIQLMEIANAVSSLKRLDLNGNGELTPDELRPVVIARNWN